VGGIIPNGTEVEKVQGEERRARERRNGARAQRFKGARAQGCKGEGAQRHYLLNGRMGER